jgi:hypothetical protein
MMMGLAFVQLVGDYYYYFPFDFLFDSTRFGRSVGRGDIYGCQRWNLLPNSTKQFKVEKERGTKRQKALEMEWDIPRLRSSE